MKILQINTSAKTADSNSSTLARMISDRLFEIGLADSIDVLELAKTPHPPLDSFALGALFSPQDTLSDEQKSRVALDDALIDRTVSADILVIGVPMYNFGVSTQFKSWIDAIVKAGKTFRYTDKGPEGLIKGKKVYVALARGGKIFRDSRRYASPLHQKNTFIHWFVGYRIFPCRRNGTRRGLGERRLFQSSKGYRTTPSMKIRGTGIFCKS